ncbi:MAG: low temperature requirement protein A [Ornithinimicrobium sp.]
MSTDSSSQDLLRDDEVKGHVGPIELLFDLVYVFTIIQLSHYVVEHLSVLGLAQATVLFLAVWWGWNYTAWAMNWLNPHSRTVQLLLAVLMLAALCMAIATPYAFSDRATLFVSAYLVLQLVRSAFMVYAFRGQQMGQNYAQLLVWSGASGVLWVAGLFVPEDARLYVWALAVIVDYAAPRFGYWVPGKGATAMSSWPLTESHLAERNRLVFIIALGESVLVLGGALVGIEYSFAVIVAAIAGFTTMFLLWWLYFDYRQGNAEHEVDDDTDTTAAARGAYAYAHALMVGGAIMVAVGIEEVVHHPLGDTPAMVAVAIVAGPIIYLVGNFLFQRALWGRSPVSRFMGMGLLLLVGLTAIVLPPVGVSLLVVAVGLGLAVVDSREKTEVPSAAHT